MTIFEGAFDRENDEKSFDALGRYKFTFENGLFTLTEFKWVFTWKYGATYNGTGKYVTEAGATVKEVYAYTSASTSTSRPRLPNPSITARRSREFPPRPRRPARRSSAPRRRRSPLGGIDVDVEATSHGMFESTTVGCHITLHGDGTSRIATCDQN